jgi:hypothetical protein
MQNGLRPAASAILTCLVIGSASAQDVETIETAVGSETETGSRTHADTVGIVVRDGEGGDLKIAWHYIWDDQVTFRTDGFRYRAVAISVPLDPITPDAPNDSFVFGVVVNQIFQRPGTIVANIDRVTWENIDTPVF